MPPATSLRSRRRILPALVLAFLPWIPTAAEPTGSASFTLVAEMETPPGILARPKAERQPLQRSAGAVQALAQFEAHVRHHWPHMREVDLATLSRFQIEETRGYRLPEDPGRLIGRALAWDDATGRWHLELRGPRLPARYEIVHRYLHIYTTFDPATGEFGDLVVTIHGWVLE